LTAAGRRRQSAGGTVNAAIYDIFGDVIGDDGLDETASAVAPVTPPASTPPVVAEAPPVATPSVPTQIPRSQLSYVDQLPLIKDDIEKVNVGILRDLKYIDDIVDRMTRKNLYSTPAEDRAYVESLLTGNIGASVRDERPPLSPAILRELQPALDAAAKAKTRNDEYYDIDNQLDDALNNNAPKTRISALTGKRLAALERLNNARAEIQILIAQALMNHANERPGIIRRRTPQIDFSGNVLVSGQTTVETQRGKPVVVDPKTLQPINE
jgi:hypothetical protein